MNKEMSTHANSHRNTVCNSRKKGKINSLNINHSEDK